MPSSHNRHAQTAIKLVVTGLALGGVGWSAMAQTPKAQTPKAQTPKAQTVASGLQHPWAVAFLPEGAFW